MTERIIIDNNKLEYLSSKQNLILKLFATSLQLGEIINSSSNPNENKLWIILSGTKINTRKAKKFINSLCYPEVKDRISIEKKSADILRSKNFINNLIEQYQVFIEVLNNQILIQGSAEDAASVKQILNAENIRIKEPIVFSIDDKSEDSEIIFLKDSYELFDDTNSKNFNSKSVRKNEKFEKNKIDNLVQFEPKKSTLKNQDCEIIHFVPSSSKQESKNTNNSASLNEYAELFSMEFDKEAEKLNKVKRIDKLISVMPDQQKILALNHVNSYQKKNLPKMTENDSIIFFGQNPANSANSHDVAFNNFENMMQNFETENNSNRHQIKFESNKAKNRARSRTERDSNQTSNTQNDKINQNNKHNRSKSSAPVKKNNSRELRHIIIDGSNVAREHGKLFGKFFSCKGIKLAVDYFLNRGHENIYAVVPRFRRGNSDKECPTRNPEILDELEEKGLLTYTPSRYVENRLIVSYDDRFILDAALYYDGIIVSNDNYRDLMKEKPEWKKLVENNLLLFSFIGDLFMVAADPMGRNGPKLDEFLTKPSGKSNDIKQIHSSSVLTGLQPNTSSNDSQLKNLINFKQSQSQVLKKKKNRTEEREQLVELLKDIFPNDENNIRSLVYEYKEIQDVKYSILSNKMFTN
ncbi:ribonuclease, partial [Brachionus plicatilis]